MQIDQKMMGELQATQKAIKPSDTLLVIDAMTGQEAASLTKAFNDATTLTGVSKVLAVHWSTGSLATAVCSDRR